MPAATQTERLLSILSKAGIARAGELRKRGITGATLARAVAAGDVARISRGLYQLPGAEADVDQSLAETAKRIPKGTICLVSALAYHGLTDQLPRTVWVAIGPKDRTARVDYPPVRFVRFRQPYLHQGIERHAIAGVKVPIYSVEKSIADAFRNSRLVDKAVAIECLRTALKERKATPASLAKAARENGAWTTIRPYLEALTSDG